MGLGGLDGFDQFGNGKTLPLRCNNDAGIEDYSQDGGFHGCWVTGHDSLQVLSEVRIEGHSGVAFPRLPEDLRDKPPASVRSPDDSHGAMVLLHDHLNA